MPADRNSVSPEFFKFAILNKPGEKRKTPDKYKEKGYILDQMADYEVKVETVIERTARSMTE